MSEPQQAGVPYAWPKQHGLLGGAAWSAVATAFLVAIAVVFAMGVRSAFLFVSLGPIVYEFIARPLARASSPRSTILANAVALIVGYSVLAVFGLSHDPSSVQEGVTAARAIAVVCAIALTGALLVLLRAVHPPAGSTLLLVTLGIMHQPVQLACVFAMIVLITFVAFLLNRIAGVPVPAWSSPKPPPFADETP